MAKNTKNQRINFASSKNILECPDLLEVQIQSFKDFFQMGSTPEDRRNEGLFKVFQEIFPIEDTRNNYKLEFIDYFVGPPVYTIQECFDMGQTYKVPLKAKLRLSCSDPEHEDFTSNVTDVFLGDVPYMTPAGTFIFNGSERIVVSQLHRSPGVFFGQSFHANGTKLYSARIIPFKGSWIEFATDINNVMYAYIDRKKKLPVTTLLRAIGYDSDKDIIDIFDLADKIKVTEESLRENLGRKLAAKVLKTWTEDFVDEDTGEVIPVERVQSIVERGEELTEETIEKLLENHKEEILLQKDEDTVKEYGIIYNTLQKDPTNTEIEAVNYIYKQLRNSEPPDDTTARDVIDKLFFSEKRYDLGDVGRYRINRKLHLEDKIEDTVRVLTNTDIIEIIKYIVLMINGKAIVDDIDHLSNRRIRTVGEQLAAQFSVGLSRMARTIKERMNVRDSEQFSANELINSKTLSSVINSFFGTSQLSQFMDQTNPLAEMTHKRRLSALGPGGLSRERAGFEVRDVHYTHYGRLCPIETPEGPNIGLISSLCVYARINNLGFIETPYRKVQDGKVDLKDVVYMTAEQEENQAVSLANIRIADDGTILEDRIQCRLNEDFPVVTKEEVNYIDVAPNQIASVAASLIPFLEHDDAHRALMGANMMRQAVPLLCPEAPIVGTGLEERVCLDSRTQVVATGKGEVTYVDANEIRIKYERTDDEKFVSFKPDETVYTLPIYRRTNQSTTITLKPIVRKGDKVVAGQVLTEGYATQNGELALGRNLKVAFMPWKGYNYEDAIVLSERMIRGDVLTSVHVDEFVTEVRETKRGEEELTADIPNVSEDATKDLDENGIIRIGAHIEPGDIMVGKTTPKGESDPSPEEKLLRAIFGDKAGDVKDASLKANPSLSGTIINTALYQKAARDTSRRGAKSEQKLKIEKLEDDFAKKEAKDREKFLKKLDVLATGAKSNGIFSITGEEIIGKNKTITLEELKNINYELVIPSKWTKDKGDLNDKICALICNYLQYAREAQAANKRIIDKIKVGDELNTGVMKLAKVYVARKRKIRVGDKLAGRHGNKGIVAKVVRDEDMPFLSDGTPVDIVLNPLGVPSRMNLGQIYETVLGWAGSELGLKFSTPIFDGASLEDICAYTDQAGLPRFGKTRLRDGGTGDWFDQPATVGVIYMIKLGHMVDDKMHARSIGPYSLITQQPLGGKAQFGGQRFGEMEVWALEAFGASNVLQEVLTVKSDDVTGRSKTYEAIVKGDPMPAAGIPESLNVLLHELRGLGLKVTLD